MDLLQFFNLEAMDVYAVLPVSDCSAPEGFHPRNLLPAAKTLIVFGKAVPSDVYSLGSREKTKKLHEVITLLEKTAARLSQRYNSEGFTSVPVPSFFPVRVHKRRIMGFLSLKHCAQEAGLGVIGGNTLLISPEYGNRLALGAVVTEKELEPVLLSIGGTHCFECGKCIKACPVGALTENGVDVLRCENVSHAVPRSLRPFFCWMFGKNAMSPLLQRSVNRIAWDTEMLCSRCLTACPHFKESGKG